MVKPEIMLIFFMMFFVVFFRTVDATQPRIFQCGGRDSCICRIVENSDINDANWIITIMDCSRRQELGHIPLISTHGLPNGHGQPLIIINMTNTDISRCMEDDFYWYDPSTFVICRGQDINKVVALVQSMTVKNGLKTTRTQLHWSTDATELVENDDASSTNNKWIIVFVTTIIALLIALLIILLCCIVSILSKYHISNVNI